MSSVSSPSWVPCRLPHPVPTVDGRGKYQDFRGLSVEVFSVCPSRVRKSPRSYFTTEYQSTLLSSSPHAQPLRRNVRTSTIRAHVVNREGLWVPFHCLIRDVIRGLSLVYDRTSKVRFSSGTWTYQWYCGCRVLPCRELGTVPQSIVFEFGL